MRYLQLCWRYMLLLIVVASCSKMEDTHLEYAGDGEITYISKVDSIHVLPGRNRVRLSWSKGIDPRASRAVVYWENGQESVDVNYDANQDSATVLIEQLPEGNYTFEVVVLDEDGNRSTKTSQYAPVYGDRYLNSLQNRRFRTALIKDPHVEINWFSSLQDGIGSEIKYTDANGQEQVVFVEPGQTQVILNEPDSNHPILYRSYYRPDGISLDTFVTAYEEVRTENLLEKTKFKRWNPDGIPYREYLPHLALFPIEKLWDNDQTGIGYIYLEYNPLPDTSDFTFDLGVEAKLERLRYHMDTGGNLYRNGNVKRFQVWGSATPNVNEDLSGWTFLGDFTSHKPSGLPPGQNTTADVIYAQAGENFTFVEGAPSVRYIRILVLETWTPVVAHMTELTFWGDLVK